MSLGREGFWLKKKCNGKPARWRLVFDNRCLIAKRHLLEPVALQAVGVGVIDGL